MNDFNEGDDGGGGGGRIFDDGDVVVKEETDACLSMAVFPADPASSTCENCLEPNPSNPFYYHQTFVAAVDNAECDTRCLSLLREDELDLFNAFHSLSFPAQLFVFIDAAFFFFFFFFFQRTMMLILFILVFVVQVV